MKWSVIFVVNFAAYLFIGGAKIIGENYNKSNTTH